MKATIIYEHGDLDVLRYEDVPIPEPGEGEVLVRLRAAALNHIDLMLRQGLAQVTAPLPMILGVEGAGEVAQVGPGVDGGRVGERVVIDPLQTCGECRYCRGGREHLCHDFRMVGEHMHGTYAEYIVVPVASLIPIPEDISFEKAAAAVVAFLTAWHLLIARGELRAGETMLVVGAGGGVASAGVQIARLAGARVIATTSTEDKARRLRELGADEVFNYREIPDFDRAVLELTNGEGVDVVQDNVGQTTFQRCLNSLSKGGRFLGVGSFTGTMVQAQLWQIYNRELRIIGAHLGTHAELRTVLDLIWRGRLQPIVDRSFPLSEARAAQQRLTDGAQLGKIILVPE